MPRSLEAAPLLHPRSTSRSLARAALFAPFLAVVATIAGCDVPPPNAPTRPLPAYAGRSLQLFDDALDPNAVGISLDFGVDPRTDKLLRERTQIGDAAIRVRVTTVTSKEDEGVTRYLVALKTVEKLAGQFPPPETFEIRIGKSSPSARLLKGLEGQIVGKTFVAFLRAFIRPDGDQELHFHLAADSKIEVASVKDAAILAGL